MGKFTRTLSKCYLWREYILIFVSLGTKRFQFNRLLKELDLLKQDSVIKESIFAQIGNSSYIPNSYSYERFISPQKYDDSIDKSNIVITHGGTGAIVKALKAEKQVIAVPRRKKYGEHSDDHQLQIVNFFEEQGYLYMVDNIKDLESTLKEIKEKPITKRFIGNGKVLDIIGDFIKEN